VKAALLSPFFFFSLCSAVLAAPADFDNTFGNGGRVTLAGSLSPSGVVLQADGKMVVVGSVDGFAVARFNADGSLDQSFGTGGTVVTPISGTGLAKAVAVQADGKIVAVGGTFNAPPNEAFAVVRYNPDGTPDQGFGNGGIVTTDFGSSHDRAYGVAFTADGKIVAAGTGGLVRYNTNGSLDPNFGTNGKAVISDFQVYDVAVQADGKVVVVGHGGVKRFTTSGVLDVNFGSGGKITTNDILRCVAIQPNGKIVVAGDFNAGGGGWDFAVTRYSAGGSLDQTFGTGGRVTTYQGEGAEGMALQPDGKIVVAGRYSYLSYDMAVVRFNADGTLDPTFDFDGLQTDDSRSDDRAWGVAVQPDGGILVVGEVEADFSEYSVLMRLEGGPFVPVAATQSATNVSGDGAIMKGSVDPNRASTVVKFEYGTTTDYGSSVTVSPSVGIGNHPVPVSATVSGLLPNTTYHFRTVAVNSQGTVYGADATFTTQDRDPNTLPPLILTQPVAAPNSSPGTQVTFEIDATGSGTSSYQWYKGGVAIRGATKPSFTLTSVKAADVGSYSCVVSNGVGKVKSQAVLLTLADSGPIIYKAKGTGALTEGAGTIKAPVSGYLLFDRVNQTVAVIWMARQGKQKIYWVEQRPDLAIHSTGPVPKSATLVAGNATAGEDPNFTYDLVWLKGTDAFVKLSADRQLIAPLSMTGTAGRLTLGDKPSIETLTVSLVMDKAATLASRVEGDSVSNAIVRIGSALARSGYVKVGP
jgi:uncharacterized delta-60 repeat protein